ncbi:ubiquitin-specific protease ubp2 [Mortierella sp. GBA43]|nr:ubiquitin-specific protease ubp2 [Mortierella sp. GBA43]
MMPHPHLYVVNPHEREHPNSFNIWCQTCFIQFDLLITPQGNCKGLTHHIHTDIDEGVVTAECCHCGLHITAVREQPSIPRSVVTRIEKARAPKANVDAPHFHDTLTLMIRILKDAATPADEAIASRPGSINVESKAFRTIGLDDSSRAFFEHARFKLIEQRYHPPEWTPENAQFLNRCRFQLELCLWLSKQPQSRGVFDYFFPENSGIKIEPAYQSIFQTLGVAHYARDPRSKQLDLTNPATLNSEKTSDSKPLGCLSDMSDGLILDAFRTQVSHDPSKSHARVDALRKIQRARNSEELELEIICKRSEGIVTSEELRRAYRDFEIPNEGENISNEILVGLVRASLHSNSKENLKIIARARNYPEINLLLEESQVPAEFPVVDADLVQYYAQNPVGLSNIGNTCYLNSLLQYIYTIKDIRETVMTMELHVENENAEDWKGKVVDGRSLSRRYVVASKELVRELERLFMMMESAKTRSVTPSNRLVHLLLPSEGDESTPNGDNAAHKGNHNDYHFFQQQDVSETLAILMAKLNAAFKPVPLPENKHEDRFNNLFYVRAHRKSIEMNKETGKIETERIREDFSTLLLNVGEEDITMEELMDDYFEPQEKEPDNKDVNDESGNSEAAPTPSSVRHITVTELPPVLQIQLMRTHFNRSHMTSYKSNAKVSIPKRLHMDQYLEPTQEENADRIKRIKLWKEERTKCRRAANKIKSDREIAKELRKFEDNSAPSTSHVPNGTAAGESHPEGEPPKDTLPEGGEPEVKPSNPPDTKPVTTVHIEASVQVEADDDDDAEEEAVELSRITDLTEKINEEAASLSPSVYNLHAVFHHEGSADFGHYWVYIYDDQAEEPRWLKYSDDRVEVAQENEVLNGTQGSSVCFCVYTRSSSDTVQTVWRCITD